MFSINKLLKIRKQWKEKKSKALESGAIFLFILSAALIAVGTGVGTFIPGLPILLVICGSLLVLVAIFLYIVAEFARIFSEE